MEKKEEEKEKEEENKKNKKNKNKKKLKLIVMYDQKARTWKQPRCPSTEEWIRKMWYIYTMEYYAAEKNNDIMKFAGKWMKLENVTLSEVPCSVESASQISSVPTHALYSPPSFSCLGFCISPSCTWSPFTPWTDVLSDGVDANVPLSIGSHTLRHVSRFCLSPLRSRSHGIQAYYSASFKNANAGTEGL
ncbi:hypothetical protein STEG23_033638, partial [Scotinomys teguina]